MILICRSTEIVRSEWSWPPLWALKTGFAVVLPFPQSHLSSTPNLFLSSEIDEEDQTKQDHSSHCSTDDGSYRYSIIATVPAAIITSVVASVGTIIVIRSTVWVARIVGS